MLKKNTELVVSKENPFENDCLDREKSIINLSKLIGTIDQPFVISVEAPWGFGKTTFIKMWKAYLENDKHICLYFNAWENDFSDDPLIAFISELSSQIEENKIGASNHPELQQSITKLKHYGSKLAKNALPLLLEALTKGILSKEFFNDFSRMISPDQIAELMSEYTADQIKNYEENKKGIENFIRELENLVNLLKEKDQFKLPLVIFVDELDRCRPNFAIETLERIKHVFNAKNILFVLAIDRDQLSSSLKTIYGSDMETDGYLRRFIDLSYSIPNPSREKFCHFLDKKFEISSSRKLRSNTGNNNFITSASVISEVFSLSLREIEQCFTMFFLITRTIDLHCFEPALLAFLTVLRTRELAIYEKLKSKNTDIDEILSTLGNQPEEYRSFFWLKKIIHAHLVNYFFKTEEAKYSYLDALSSSDDDAADRIRNIFNGELRFIDREDVMHIISSLEILSDFDI